MDNLEVAIRPIILSIIGLRTSAVVDGEQRRGFAK